jgi:hypothetical protein
VGSLPTRVTQKVTESEVCQIIGKGVTIFTDGAVEFVGNMPSYLYLLIAEGRGSNCQIGFNHMLHELNCLLMPRLDCGEDKIQTVTHLTASGTIHKCLQFKYLSALMR